MPVDELPAVDPNVDYTQILPIQQKRTIAFVNQFIMNTVSYLNHFAQSCESRFMDFEYKLQKVEASLLILESQLSSIDGLEKNSELPVTIKSEAVSVEEKAENDCALELPAVTNSEQEEHKEEQESMNGVKACEHPGYRKFFKMIQFGVPEPAVRLKMQSEGMDPDILNNPNEILSPPTVKDGGSASDDSSSS